MSDPRSTPFNGRVAHVSLEGQVDAQSFTPGVQHLVANPTAALSLRPGGERDRELLWGDGFCALDVSGEWTFGFCEKDGYCGYVRTGALIAAENAQQPSHRVCALRTYANTEPDLKITGNELHLSYGSRVVAQETIGQWTAIRNFADPDGSLVYVPANHIEPIEEHAVDPVEEAEKFIGTPYLWGGNSAFGLDCSGLVQIAALTCGIQCPGDSDQQAMAFGGMEFEAPIGRGELFFWKGHVAIATNANTLIHANAHHMAVQKEPIKAALNRIEASETGPLTARGSLKPV